MSLLHGALFYLPFQQGALPSYELIIWWNFQPKMEVL